jgi:hypothetical protein
MNGCAKAVVMVKGMVKGMDTGKGNQCANQPSRPKKFFWRGSQ